MLLTAILWANPGEEALLVAYEDAVLQLIPKHGGRVIERVRAEQPSDGPYEVQTIELPDDEALAAYMVDPARLALADQHARAIARTEVLRGASVL
jgi:uncharacterized protein (DUF1330 family)